MAELNDLLNSFTRICLVNNKDVSKLASWFANTIEEKEDKKIVQDNFMLFIKTGEAIKEAPKEVREELEIEL